MQIVTYHSTNASPDRAWFGYFILNGQISGVRFFGHSEGELKAKIAEFYSGESHKQKKLVGNINHVEKMKAPAVAQTNGDALGSSAPVGWPVQEPKKDGRGAHFIGKVWMIHSQTREKVRIPQEQVEEYVGNGYVRGGPRSK